MTQPDHRGDDLQLRGQPFGPFPSINDGEVARTTTRLTLFLVPNGKSRQVTPPLPPEGTEFVY